MNNLAISPKVGAGALAGATVAIGVWAVQQFAHVTLPADVAASATVIVTALVAYCVPHAQ